MPDPKVNSVKNRQTLSASGCFINGFFRFFRLNFIHALPAGRILSIFMKMNEHVKNIA